MHRPIAILAAALLTALSLSLAACGGDDDGAGTGQTSASPTGDSGKLTVAALGDSITAGSPLWDPEPSIQQQLGPQLDEQSQFEYWAERADASLDFSNCGVFGERTEQIAARLDACVQTAAPGGADVLIVQGGINDIAQGASIDDAAESLREMVRTGLDQGLEVAIADVLPWNNGHPDADRPIEQLNEMIAAIAESEGVPLLPFHDTLENPAEPGTMKEEWTIDGDHPSVKGYRLLAERAVLPNLPADAP